MGHHRSSEAGIFDFVDNVKTYRELGDQIAKKIAAIRGRINGDHTVGNGNFVKLESLRHAQRQALAKILKGILIIAVAAGAAATIIIASDGCGETGKQDSSVLTERGGVVL